MVLRLLEGGEPNFGGVGEELFHQGVVHEVFVAQQGVFKLGYRGSTAIR